MSKKFFSMIRNGAPWTVQSFGYFRSHSEKYASIDCEFTGAIKINGSWHHQSEDNYHGDLVALCNNNGQEVTNSVGLRTAFLQLMTKKNVQTFAKIVLQNGDYHQIARNMLRIYTNYLDAR